VTVPQQQPFASYAEPAPEDRWNFPQFGGGNQTIANAYLPLGAADVLAPDLMEIAKAGAGMAGDTIWDGIKAGWNTFGDAALGAAAWWQDSAAKERFDQQMADRELWRGIDPTWKELGENFSQIEGPTDWRGIGGALLTGAMGVAEKATPQWGEDAFAAVTGGLQAAQDAINLTRVDEVPIVSPLMEKAFSVVSGQKADIGNDPFGSYWSAMLFAGIPAAAKEAVTAAAAGEQYPIQRALIRYMVAAGEEVARQREAVTPTAEQAATMTPAELRRQQDRANLNFADPAAVAKTFDALADQTSTVQTLTQKAQAALKAAESEQDEDARQELMTQAADFGTQAYELEHKHPIALVNENTNIARQMIAELLQPDVTDLLGGVFDVIGMTPAARRLTRATGEVIDQDENVLAKLLKYTVTPENRKAMEAATSGYNPAALYKPSAWWTTGEARAGIAADKMHRFVTNLMADVDTVADAKLLLRQVAEKPAALIQGIAANLFQSDGLLARADQDGLIRFGNMGLLSPITSTDSNLMYKVAGLTNKADDPLKIFQQVADEFLNGAESLKNGVLLNKVDFANEFIDAMQTGGYKFYNVVDEAGKLKPSPVGQLGDMFRKTVSPIYIYLNPGGWATNYLSGVVGAFGDKTFATDAWKNIQSHLTKLYGVDPTVRGLEGAAGSMTAAGQQLGGLWGPLKKAYGQIDETVGTRVYYAGVTHALQKTGKDVLQNTMAPILQSIGITDPRQASSLINHLFETGYSGGNLVEEFNKLVTGQARVFSLSDVNAGWLDALPADSLSEFYDIIRKAPDVPTAQTQLTAWADKATAYWDNLIQSSPVIPARHTWLKQEAVQDAADLAQVGKLAQKGGVPTQAITEWKKATTAALQDTQRRMEALMNVVAESAKPENRYMLYNIWGQVTDLTTDVRAKLGDMAERAGMLPTAQRNQAWGKYWEEARRLWDERNAKVNDLLEKGAQSVASGEAFTPNLSQWDILERTAKVNEQKLWDTLRLEPAAGAYDRRLAQVIDAGRQLTDKAVARTYAAARRFAEVDAMDYIISAERNAQMAGAQARAYLDEVLEVALKNGKWEDYYSIRNETWRQLRQYEQQIWGIAERNIVRDGLGAEKTTGLKFNNGFDGVVELISPVEVKGPKTSRLGREKTVTEQTYTDWLVRREDGTTTTIPDSQVPQALKDKYRGVTPADVETAVQDELDNIASANPFAEDAQKVLDDLTVKADEGAPVVDEITTPVVDEIATKSVLTPEQVQKLQAQGIEVVQGGKPVAGTVTAAPVTPPIAPASVTGLDAMGGELGRAISDNLRMAWRQAVEKTGKLPAPEQQANSLINQVYERLIRDGAPRNTDTVNIAIDLTEKAGNDAKRMGEVYKDYKRLSAPLPAAPVQQAAPVADVAPFVQPGQVATAVQATPAANTLQTLRDIAKQAGLPTANANGSPLDLPLWNAVKKYFADNNIPLQAQKLTDLAGQELEQAIRFVGERVGVTKASDMYRAQAAGGAAAAKDLAAMWDADVTAKLGLPKMEILAKQYRDGQRVFEFEDLHGTTVAGKRIENSNDVLKLVEQYIGLRSDVASAQQTVKATQKYSKMSKAEILRAERDNLLKAGYSTEELNTATRNEILRFLEITTQKPLPDPSMVFFEGSLAPGLGNLVEKVKKALNLGNSAQVQDLNKVADVTIRNTTRAGGILADDIAYGAQHARDQIANLLAYVNGNLDNIMAPKGAIAEGQALRAINDFRRQVLPAWDNAKAVASEYGNRMRSFTMVDFANNTRVDELLSLAFPYSFWSTRAAKNARERAIFEPHIWRRMMQAHNYMNQMADQRGDPDRYDGLFPVDLGNGMTYYLRIDPSKYWPTLGLFMQNDYADPESANNAFSFGLEAVRSSGFNPYPWFDAIGKAYSNIKEGKPAGQDMSVVDYVPIGKPLAWLAARAGVQLPQWAQPGFYEYNIARELTTMVSEGSITADQAQYAQDILRTWRTGEQMIPEVQAQQEALSAILRTATERAANKELMASGSSWATGVQVKPFDQDERQAMQAKQMYQERAYNPVSNPYGSEMAQSATFDQYPELSPRFSQSAVLNEDNTRPGASAALGQRIAETKDARDTLYGMGDAAVDALLKANPQATKKEMAAARTQAIIGNAGQFVDPAALDAWLKANPDAYYSEVVKFVTDTISAKYPSADLVEGSGKPKDYAPLEQKWNFQEDTLKKAAEQFPYPTFPEGGTPQQIAAYMEQKKAIDAQRQQWMMQQLTTGGAQLMPNWMKGSTAVDAAQLATDPTTAQGLITENKYQYATEAERKRLEEIERTGGSGGGSAVYRQAYNNVAGRFGKEDLAIWEGYYKLPKGSEAREQYKRDNPGFKLLNLYAYNRADVERGFTEIGIDGALAWSRIPAYDGTPENKAARDQYFDENPKAWLFNAWLNGRPANYDETKQEGETPKYNFGADYAEARKLFGDNIWEIAGGYKRGWDKAQTRAYFQANPQLSDFFDWWYGDDGKGKSAGTGRSYGGYGGGGGYSGGSYDKDGKKRPGFNPYFNSPYVSADEMDNYLMPRENYINKWRPENASMAWLNAGQRLAPTAPLAKWTPGSKWNKG